MSNNKHLTRDERIIIQTGISNGSKKTSIADTLQKEKSTVGKEIKQHRFLKAKSTLLKECTNYKNANIIDHAMKIVWNSSSSNAPVEIVRLELVTDVPIIPDVDSINIGIVLT